MRASERKASGEKGFTLVEIMASIVLLAIVGLGFSGYFYYALSNAKGNQNKTVMVNLARNTLFYMQKQGDFAQMRTYFKVDEILGSGEQPPTIVSEACTDLNRCTYYETANSNSPIRLVSNPDSLPTVLNPYINGVHYRVTISYQKDLFNTLESSVRAEGNANIGQYLLPIKVVVEEAPESGGASTKRERTEVEGYIADEKIR